MQDNRQGVSYQDIEAKIGVARKTAERYIKCIRNSFGENMIDELQPEWEKQKRWGFVNYTPSQLVNFTTREIALLELIKSFEPFHKYVNEIEVIIDKMKTRKK